MFFESYQSKVKKQMKKIIILNCAMSFTHIWSFQYMIFQILRGGCLMRWFLAAVLGVIVALGVTAVVFSAVAGEDCCVGTAGVGWSSGLLQSVMFDISLGSEFSLVFLR